MTVSEVLEPVTDFIKKQSRLTLTVVSLLILFTISGIIVVCIQSSKDTRKKTLAPYDETFVPIDEFLAPSQPSIVEDHYYARQKDGIWDSDDEERWFTDIDQQFVEELSSANDKLAESIIGAAP